jgi:H+/Cl- antiporter ClcA
LIGGFSLGPEVPTGMLGGAVSTWLSERRQLSKESEKINVLSGVMGAYGGLFTSPFGVILMPLEMGHIQSPAYYGTLIIAALAAVTGFVFFFITGGDQFADLLRILDLPAYDLKVWHLGMAVILGVVGTVLAVIFALLLRLFKRLMAPLERQPELRSTLAGLLLGLLGMALPLTLFLGTNGLETVTSKGAQLGVTLLIVVLLAKIVALAGALAGGFIGGPIFPLLFVGGTAGVVINLIFPAIPLALCVGCMMVAVPGAILPIPISLSVIVLLITGIPVTEVVPIPIAALVAYLIVNGVLGLGGQEAGPEKSTVEVVTNKNSVA